MKKTLLLSSAFALATGLNAQMADYRICPDWTGTDLDGVTHNLYDYLDQGYTVIIDVSAAWCGPCWNYHETHALRDLYDTYGPGTAADKVMVFFIEGESQNTGAQLTGTSGSGALFSHGDWVEGTTYPIIDDAEIADLLEIGYFPTVYRICPNRMITEVGQLSTSAMWTSCQQCDKYEADSPSDGSVLPNVTNDVTCIGSTVDLSIRLQNTGTTPLTSATIEAKRGTTVLGTQDWTGNLGTYELETVTVASFVPTQSSNNIVYTILTTDDESANNTANGSVTASATIMPGVDVVLELRTDQYPQETSWKLFDEAGTIVEQSPSTPYAASTVITENWTLNDNECYRFEIYDAFGDGICCDYGQGYYRLKVDGVNIVTGGSFDEVDVKPYKTSVAAAVEENVLENGLAVFPNPTEGRLNVTLDLPGAAQVGMTLSNILGAIVMQDTRSFMGGSQTITLDLSSLAQGTYTLNLVADGMTATRKVTITH